MRSRLPAIACLALLATAGCRIDPRITALEQENFQLENRIYELEDTVAQYERELGTCRGATSVAPVETAPGAPSEIRAPATEAPRATAPNGGRDRPAAPAQPGRVTPPKTYLPEQALPPGQVPEIFRTRPGTQPPQGPSGPLPGPAGPPSGTQPESGDGTRRRVGWSAGGETTRVTSIALNRMFTGGYSAAGKPGDDGITVAIEPRDAAARLVRAAAPVSVVVLDPAVEGPAARVARWDFTEEQIAAMMQDMRLSEGIHLAMTWPGTPPAHGRLHLYVRYVTADGRKLQADAPIEVNVAGREVRRWNSTAPAEPPADQSGRNETRWRRGAAPLVEPPTPQAAEAAAPAAGDQLRLASRPEPPPDRTAETASPTSEPQRRRPTWSPERK
jgi:hypothetical protein